MLPYHHRALSCLRSPLNFRPLFGQIFPCVSCASSPSHSFSPSTFFCLCFSFGLPLYFGLLPFSASAFLSPSHPFLALYHFAASIFIVLVFISDQPFFLLHSSAFTFFPSQSCDSNSFPDSFSPLASISLSAFFTYSIPIFFAPSLLPSKNISTCTGSYKPF